MIFPLRHTFRQFLCRLPSASLRVKTSGRSIGWSVSIRAPTEVKFRSTPSHAENPLLKVMLTFLSWDARLFSILRSRYGLYEFTGYLGKASGLTRFPNPLDLCMLAPFHFEMIANVRAILMPVLLHWFVLVQFAFTYSKHEIKFWAVTA